MNLTRLIFSFLTLASLQAFGQEKTLFFEDFENLALGPNVDESVEGEAVWTNEPPEGWAIDNSQLFAAEEDGVGVTEWKGWAFATKDWWVTAAEDQRRSEFAFGENVVAIADPDEWDDIGSPGGQSPGGYNTFMSTPSIDISGVSPGSAVLTFDSSWRPEFDDNYHQSGNLKVSFDGGEPIELFEWLSDSSSPNYKDEAINESLTIPLNNPDGASSMVITFGMFDAGNDWWWALDNIKVVGTVVQATLFSEDFEGLALGPNVDEAVEGDMVWTNEPPEGWAIDNSQLFAAEEDGVGVTEWKGWAFATKDWWVTAAEDQRRSEFAFGENTVAIADPDEWDDIGSPGGQSPGGYNTFMSTPPIDISGINPGSAVLTFDSSWRPEFDDNYHQSGNLKISFDGGEPIELFEWLSDSSSPNYKDEAINESVTVLLNNPEGAQEMVLTFGMFDAGNDWWWAIDNIEIVGFVVQPPLFSEDFEGLTLGPNVDEAAEGDMVWTNEPPEGWAIDNSQLFGAEEEGVGVTEWKGWAFASKDWWVTAAEDQRRSEFAFGENTVAIADPDEWDDIGSPGGQSPGGYNTFMSTPPIDVSGINSNSAVLSFDSSWRPEFDDNYHQSGNLKVSFDGGEPIELFEWLSDSSSPNYKDEAINERITVPLNNPEGAQEMVITFGMFDAGNDWWWAIDNIEVAVVVNPPTTVIARANSLSLEVLDAGLGIDTATLALQVDGQAVPSTVSTPEENVIRIEHTPSPAFAPESTHSYVITGSNASGAPITVAGQFSIRQTNTFAGGFLTTRQVWAADGAQIGGPDEAEAALAGEIDLQGDITIRHPIAHFNDNSGPAFEKDLSIPYPLWAEQEDLLNANILSGERLGGGLGDRNHFATETTGEFYLREGGNIQFVCSVAYGFRLEIDGVAVGEETHRFRGNTVMEVELEAGVHALRLLHWADTGAAGLSLYIARRPNIDLVAEHEVGVEDFELLSGFNICDVVTEDSDGDGMDDFKETFFFGDLTRDGSGDEDGDGLADARELELCANPTVTDSDGDGLDDGNEVDTLNTDPANPDSDGDSLADGVEVEQYGTDPNQADSDGDGFADNVELALGNDPLQAGDKPDAIIAVTDGVWSDPSTWSDGLAPSAGKSYVAVGTVTSKLTSAIGPFAGDSLTLIGPDMTLVLNHDGEASGNLRLDNANMALAGSATLGGALDLRGTVHVAVGGNDLTINSRLLGGAHVTFQGGSAEDFQGSVSIAGADHAFGGPINVIGTDVAGLTEGALGSHSILLAGGGVAYGYDYSSDVSVLQIQGGNFRLLMEGAIQVADIIGVDVEGGVLFSLNDLAGPGPYSADDLLGAFQLDEGISGNGTIELLGTADSDGDGLRDAWENENFGNLDSDGTGDPDGDGLSNLAEQAGGTDPNAADPDPFGEGGPTGPFDVTSPEDAIVLVNGVNDDDGNDGPPPGAEGVENVINNIGQKYLNFLDLGSGFVVTPGVGATTVTGVRFYPANDAIERDPASFVLEGSPEGADGPWVYIANGDLALPDARNAGGDLAIEPTLPNQTVFFANPSAYLSYRVTFPTVKDAAAANSVQIAEVELLGSEGGTLGEVVVPLVHYDFNEGEGTTIGNSGRGSDGELVNAAADAWQQDSPDGTAYLKFDDEGGGETAMHITTGVAMESLTDYTMTAWVNFENSSGDNMIFGQIVDEDVLHNGARDAAYYQAHWGNDHASGTIDVGSWHHVAYRYEAGVQSIHLDGEQISESAQGPVASAAEIVIGSTRAGDDRDFTGGLDDVRIYDVGLSNYTIAQIAAGGTAGGGDGGGGDGGGGDDDDRPGDIGAITKSAALLSLTLPAGATFDVEYSTDLDNWTVIATDVTGDFEDSDPGRNAEPGGFYRAVAK